jgi:hypothetical protein
MVAGRVYPGNLPGAGPQPQFGAWENSSAERRRAIAEWPTRKKTAGGRKSPPVRARACRPSRRDTPVQAASAPNPHVDDPRVDAGISFSQRCSLLELNCSTCRWPEGNPASCDFFFCGAELVRGKPYCATHCARAYRPAEETAQRPPNARVRRAMLRFRGIDTYIKHGGETATESQRVGEGE